MDDDRQSEYIALAEIEGVVVADQYYSEPEVLESIFKISTLPLHDDVKQDIRNSCAKRGDPLPSLESLTPTNMTASGIVSHLVSAGLPCVYNRQGMTFDHEAIRVFFLAHDIALPWRLFPSSPSNSKRKLVQLLEQRKLKASLLEKARVRQQERDKQDERELRRLQLEEARARTNVVQATEVQKDSPATPNAKHQPGGPTTKKLLEVAGELLRGGRLSDKERRYILAFTYKEKKLLTWDRAYKELPGVSRLSGDKKTQERNYYAWAKKGEKICRDHAA